MKNKFIELFSSELSNSDKLFIQSEYKKIFKREMRLKNTTCKDCYKDALLELINSFSATKTVYLNGAKIIIQNNDLLRR